MFPLNYNFVLFRENRRHETNGRTDRRTECNSLCGTYRRITYHEQSKAKLLNPVAANIGSGWLQTESRWNIDNDDNCSIFFVSVGYRRSTNQDRCHQGCSRKFLFAGTLLSPFPFPSFPPSPSRPSLTLSPLSPPPFPPLPSLSPCPFLPFPSLPNSSLHSPPALPSQPSLPFLPLLPSPSLLLPSLRSRPP